MRIEIGTSEDGCQITNVSHCSLSLTNDVSRSGNAVLWHNCVKIALSLPTENREVIAKLYELWAERGNTPVKVVFSNNQNENLGDLTFTFEEAFLDRIKSDAKSNEMLVEMYGNIVKMGEEEPEDVYRARMSIFSEERAGS